MNLAPTVDIPSQVATPHDPSANSATMVETAMSRTVHTDPTVDPAAAFAADLYQKISRRAYELAEQRGFSPGNELADWLRAEREVLAAPDNPLHLQSSFVS
jgi:hypothetical protein